MYTILIDKFTNFNDKKNITLLMFRMYYSNTFINTFSVLPLLG